MAPKPFLKTALTGLVAKDFLAVSLDDDRQPVSWELYPDIALGRVCAAKANYELPAPTTRDKVPAADRFVPIDHNSPAYGAADEALLV